MKKFSAILLIIGIFLLSATTFADGKKPKAKAKNAVRQAQTTNPNDLLSSLPNSDVIALMNAKKFLDEALPQILAGNPTQLAEINTKIADIKAQTGIDVRSFEKFVAGVNFVRSAKANSFEVAPIMLARGSFNSGAMLAAARLAAKGKYQEVKFGNKTIYVISISDLAPKPPKNTSSNGTTAEDLPEKVVSQTLGMSLGLVGNQIAIVAFDDNTLAIGDLARVKETLIGISAKNRLNNALAQMATKNPNAVFSFAGNVPPKMSQILGIGEDNDELAKTIDSIRQMSGFLEVSDGSATMNVTAKTLQVAQAEQLADTLTFLKSLGENLLGQKKDEKSQVYTRAIQNAKISRTNNEIQLEVNVNSADMQKLAANFKF